MASSPADRSAATPSPRTFALRETIACWNQAYEALARGDLVGVAALLDIADEHLATTRGADDTPSESRLRDEALSARGRLEHGVRAGLDAVAAELAQVRKGERALRGYGDPTLRLGGHLQRLA